MAIPPDPVLAALQSSAALDIFRRHDVEDAYLFGSRARGSATPASDADIAIRFGGPDDAV